MTALGDPAQRTSSGTRVPSPGSRLGRYELCEEIAAGGMATVMLARATGPGGFDKLVALKLIHSRYASEPSFVEMFLDEARIASRIQHPNVCSVFDFGSVGGTYYLAMDFLSGQAVSRVLKRLADDKDAVMTPALVARVCRIVAEAAEGLHAAHELPDEKGALLGVVHRDVSPHNLFVTFDGGVRVVDFGIAQATGKLHRTLTGVVKGKVAYMAPEQLRDQGVDRRADVWALGVTLWELLTLDRLFRRDNEAGSIQAVLGAPIPPPSSIRPSIPPELDAIVLRALARDPAQRTPTTRELGRALGQFVASSGQGIGMAEMAEWMEALFPAEREADRARIERARAGSPVRDTLPAPEPKDEVTRSGARPVRATADTLTAPTQPERAAATTTRTAGSTSALRIPVQRTPLVVGVLLALGLTAGGAWWLWLRPGAPGVDDPAPSAGAPPAPAPPAPLPAPAPAPADARGPAAPSAAATAERVRAPSPAPAPPAAPAPAPAATKVRPSGAQRPRAPVPPPAPARVPALPPAEEASPPPAAPAAPEPPGTLDVATPGGWADVLVGGRRVGRSPCRVSVPSGHVVVELRPFGTGAAIRAPVEVPAGGAARLVRAVEGP